MREESEMLKQKRNKAEMSVSPFNDSLQSLFQVDAWGAEACHSLVEAQHAGFGHGCRCSLDSIDPDPCIGQGERLLGVRTDSDAVAHLNESLERSQAV